MPGKNEMIGIANHLDIDPWRAEFTSPFAERAYRRYSFTDSIQAVRWACVIGILGIWLPAYSDVIFVGGTWLLKLSMSARVAITALFIYVIVLGRNNARRKHMESLLVPFVFFATAFTIIIAATRPPGYWPLIIENLGFTYAIYLFTPLNLRAVTISVVISGCIYLPFTFSRGEFTVPETVTLSLTFAVANLFGFLTARRLNTLRRIAFAKRLTDSRALRRLTLEIFERKQVEHQLKLANEQAQAARLAAEQANQAKSSFLAAMSHEIRTPLTGILGFAHLLAQSDLDEKQAFQLQLIDRCGTNLKRLLDDILDLSRVESGRNQIIAAPFNLGEMIRIVLGLIKERNTGANTQIQFKSNAPEPLWLMGDGTRLSQILINLLDNAAKFAGEHDIDFELSVKTGEDLIGLEFIISDRGPGIPDTRKAEIFEPYVTTPNIGPSGKGAGLGLAICKRLVDAMDGQIRVEDRIGGGTSFYVKLTMPLVTQSQLAALGTVAPLAAPPSGQPLSVLIVDDDEVNRILLESLVTQMGHKVGAENDGRQGVEAARTRHFDLILMDIWMPVMNGLEGIAAIRENGGASGSEVPIFVMTANMMDSDIAACWAAGADEILAKPIDVAGLRSKIDAVAQNLARQATA
jgi:signal transduction histidine kinase/ActR/RegA family two-component response regulator